MRILIVDDERLARQGLASLLAEIVPMAELHEAADGLAMVEAVRELKPEVAIVDVDMPRLDGLSAVEQLAQHEHETSFVVLSAHADFRFAQRGITLRVADYLLKPADPDHLRAAVAKALADHEARRQQSAGIFSSHVSSLAQSLHSDPARPRLHAESPVDAGGESRFTYLAAAVFRDRSPEVVPADDFPSELVDHELDGAISSPVRLSPPGARTETGLVMIRAATGTELAGLLDTACRDASGDGALVSAQWAQAPSAEAAFAQVEGALRNPELRLRGRPGRAVAVPEATSERSTTCCTNLEAVFEAAHLADEVRFLTAIEQLRATASTWPREIHLPDLAGFASTVLGHPVQWSNPRAFFDSLTALGPRVGRRSTGTAASRIKRIQEYLAENFAEPVSLAGVAKRFDLSPTYLSALFHEKTGKTFLTYLTELRIAHARKVLEGDPDVQVRELAALSGYTSVRHFSQVFRRLTGHYPSKYASAVSDGEPPGRSPSSSSASGPVSSQS